MDAIDDRGLVQRAQGGDSAAMNRLLERHYDRVHAVCRRLTGSAADADDATQEALIRIVRGIQSFDGRSSFSTWAYRIATNSSLDELRKRRRRPQLHTARDDGPTHEVADSRAERDVTATADRLALDAAVAELPDEFRTPLVMRDVADLDYSEIAAALDIPLGTVKSRIARGRRMLSERLSATYFGSAAEPGGDDGDRRHSAIGNQSPPSRRPNDVPPDRTIS